MSVIERFAHPLSQEQIERGRGYAREGDVAIRRRGETSVHAVVQVDERHYQTMVEWSGPSLGCSCTCEEFQHQAVCEHVAGTALAAESEGLISSNMMEAPASPAGTASHAPPVTQPRRRGPAVWLSPTGELRRTDLDEPRPVVRHQPSQPSWKKLLAKVREVEERPAGESAWPPDRELIYVVDLPASGEGRTLVVKLACRDRKSTGEWSKPKTRGVSFPDIAGFREPEDRRVMSMLKGAAGRGEFYHSYDPSFTISPAMRRMVVEEICKTGRAWVVLEPDSDEPRPLAWDDRPWELWLEGRRDETLQQYEFAGYLRRRHEGEERHEGTEARRHEGGEETQHSALSTQHSELHEPSEDRLPLSRAELALAGGLVFFGQTVAPLDDHGAFHWLTLLRQHRVMRVPFAQAHELLAELFSSPHLPRLELPEELRVETVAVKPLPVLKVRSAREGEYRLDRLRAALLFDYEGLLVPAEGAPARVIFQAQQRRLVIRDVEAERAAIDRLGRLGLRDSSGPGEGRGDLWFNQRHLPRVVKVLVGEGWQVEAEGKLYRRAGRLRLQVSSGIDWFELRGDVDFEGRTAKLPALLAALRRGETTVQLDDGTFGMLPESWLKKYGLLAAMGTEEEEFLKFTRTQAGLLDALLASQPDVDVDEIFERTRQEMRRFEGIEALDAPAGFQGELRGYQREGLGWFTFLERFGFGGCLADDMGLGKTVQVLALLESRRRMRDQQGAQSAEGKKFSSLVVVPKSLVFNWEEEARRFTPDLKLLDHTGIDRTRSAEDLLQYDVIITTYGTLRRDAAFMKDVEFDYVVLDEAQAIKNPASESAKAARLVKGRNRLALSGTPVQNHLGDLWSLFDFLNPGMMGNISALAAAGPGGRNPDPETRTLLARGLRPFILRRTKEQVAADLPPRLEQTIYCELEPAQRKLYDDLKDHYRRSLLDQVDRDGMGKVKMQILEALLRLRQAALHPALVDPSRAGEGSAKLEMLIPRLAEVIDEGHKALVFSQFTSMLALVREGLDREGLTYEYLDGKTRDRQPRVERFQNDPDCKLFLISLKAGGLGLNLTAADYVFLLDPWWNPAVEAQAIDRAHRIGQTRQVYACRLIAKDTVEEKVLALQQTKRDLADAIINADNSLIRTLDRSDLELLLS